MDPLPPIPTPPGQHWREFRIKVLPFLMFGCVVAGAACIWRYLIMPTNLVGQVESITASVTTTAPGLLSELRVDRFSEVTNGQPIAVVLPFDPELTKASLAAIEASLQANKARIDFNGLQSIDAATKLRLELLAQQTLLNIAQVNLNEAEIVLVRSSQMFKDKIIPEAQYDIARAKRDSLKSEVTDRTKLVAQWEADMQRLAPIQGNVLTNWDAVIEEEIFKQQEQLRQLQKPLVLKAPISGKVNAILHRAGERVMPGLPILTITPPSAERIVAYLRQPITVHPKVGDTVQVTTRTPRRQIRNAYVLQVGTQMELINPILLPYAKPVPEEGLPIAISLPSDLDLFPGEIVFLAFKR